MKPYIKNIIMIMSGGIGARFGTDCPKQYNNMKDHLVIDYVVEASKRSRSVDEIVIVVAENYMDFVQKRYNMATVAGGATRPESVAHGLQYIHEHYDCEKLIITNAVCPLASEDQYDRYFDLLNEYDFVLTTWKLAPALHRFDEKKADRDEYFNVMEPDAYRFKTLYNSYNFENPPKYIFHNMPETSKRFYCFDYPYTTKVTYPFDIPVLESLYELLIEKPRRDKLLRNVNYYISSDGTSSVGQWIDKVQEDIKEIAQKYRVAEYTLNSQTQASIVYEGYSSEYMDIIFKFDPSEYIYHKELTYYRLASHELMASLLGYDDERCVIVLGKIKPGLQVKFHVEDPQMRELYKKINDSFIPVECLNGDKHVPYFIDEFWSFSKCADRFTFEFEYRKQMEKKALKVWKAYFENAPQYYLHGDIQRRNILNGNGCYRIIDPRGTIAPKEFEYVIQFITELREDIENKCLQYNYEKIFDYFLEYVEQERLTAALFVFWVHKLNDYIYHKDDNFRLAAWCKDCIQKLFFNDNINAAMNPDISPSGVRW